VADVHPKLTPLAQFLEEGIPYNRFLGLRCDTLQKGLCVARIPWREELVGDPFRRAIHGGVTSMLADSAGGCAVFTMMNSSTDRTSTVDLRVDYLRPGPPGDLLCEARVVRMGNRVAVTRMQLYSGAMPERGTEAYDEPFATAQGVFSISRRDK
jgi:uncharacterized protein (TIGR00369 family)